MSKQELVDELHRGVRRNFNRRHVEMRGLYDTLQADLVEMIPHARDNDGMKYILVVINIFSKKAYARAVKNKSGSIVARAMDSILREINHPIKNLHVDMGNEFYNNQMTEVLEKYHIKIYSTYSTTKASIVERLNRTLKNKMWKRFSFNGSYRWVDMLQSLLDEYNDSKHRTIKMKPNSVTTRNEKSLLEGVYNRKWSITYAVKPKFQVGDTVRMTKYKHIFEKGYTPNWTAEVFKIKKIQYTNPITYNLVDLDDRDIKGTVYAEELQLAKNPSMYLVERIIRRRGNRAYVKWLGFDNSHNSWIIEDEML